jgi:hypothetical protein
MQNVDRKIDAVWAAESTIAERAVRCHVDAREGSEGSSRPEDDCEESKEARQEPHAEFSTAMPLRLAKDVLRSFARPSLGRAILSRGIQTVIGRSLGHGSLGHGVSTKARRRRPRSVDGPAVGVIHGRRKTILSLPGIKRW